MVLYIEYNICVLCKYNGLRIIYLPFCAWLGSMVLLCSITAGVDFSSKVEVKRGVEGGVVGDLIWLN